MAAVVTVASRIRALRLELAALEQQQRDELIVTVAGVVGARAFSAAELWAHAAQVSGNLRALFVEHNITSTRRLGKRLQQLHGRTLRGLRLERVGRDHQAGAIWIVVGDCPIGPCVAPRAGV